MKLGLLTKTESIASRHALKGHETDVVAGPRIFGPWVAETHNQFQT